MRVIFGWQQLSRMGLVACLNFIQYRGAVGKRARAGATLLGDPDWHRERIARLLGIGCADRAGLEA